MQFQRGHGGVKLGIAQNAAQPRTVGANTRGFLGGKFFNAIRFNSRGALRMAGFQRPRLLLAKLVQLRDGFFHQVQPFRPFRRRAGRLRIGFGQNNFFVADGGEKMFRRRSRP